MQVEEKCDSLEEIECMFCTSKMPEKMVKKYSRPQTAERYDAICNGKTKQTCQARCVASRDTHPDGRVKRSNSDSSILFKLQDHCRDVDGRVFSCEYCKFATCVECDRAEHIGEDCEEYKLRTGLLEKLPIVIGASKFKKDAIKNCPRCEAYWMLDERKDANGKTHQGCGYMKCAACQFRFCQRCLVPWVGEGSAYLLGKESHGHDETDGKACSYGPYGTRESGSGHALKKRYATTEEVATFWAGILAANASAAARARGDAAVGSIGRGQACNSRTY
ncbi:hypothetical protein LTR56_003217 [Elasticomyces elasticus]|nr:hypothetical protein LTR22_010750 [Elasticomyces elasticus]KAK3656085.1 hypothetical protein LTR56_003217 [Elasticomyces elasticus]KAK4920851.1 hypothetical protein LTR49_011573 [Elasticomyces elasticus]KAK5759631.1 hypothetical protein LTS12_010324 [Elasticomyces elasticus]